MNGSDCGMFACKYADCITKDRPINFTQVRRAFRTAKAPEPKLSIAAFLTVFGLCHTFACFRLCLITLFTVYNAAPKKTVTVHTLAYRVSHTIVSLG